MRPADRGDAGLRERDLDLKRGQLHVHQTVAKVDDGVGHRRIVLQDPRTRSSQRTVHLLPPTLDELCARHQKQPKRRLDDLIFGDEYGRPINDERLRRTHKKAAAAIGSPELRNHDLRATAVTMSAEAGATVLKIQDQRGHPTPQMALRYQTASPVRDAERARRVSAAWGHSPGG